MDFVVTNDSGGYVAEYVMRARDLEGQGRRIRIAGRCDSACTMYLIVSGVCVTKRASFGFHAPFNVDAKGNAKALRFMLANYPGWVRSWLAAQGGLTADVKRMSYSYASRHLETCK